MTGADARAGMGKRLSMTSVVRTFANGTRGVDDVSLDIGPGEFVTLLGPSGSGKTTTLKMVAGFERPDAGTIRLGDRDITDIPAHRRDIGMVFQNYALFPHMTVADNIAFPLKMRRKPKAAIDVAVQRMLGLVHLPGFGERQPKQLSGGQQQRVALARALVFSPPLLLMDEPLGALDRQLRRQVQSEIKRIQRSLGITVLFVTHDQEEALFLSDRIAIMNEGRIAQIGAPVELYANPVDRFVAEFLGEPNGLAGTPIGESDGHVLVTLDGGTRILGRSIGTQTPSARVDVLIRPERLAIRTDGAAGDHANAFTGQVELVNFLGEAVEVELAIAGQPTLRVRMPYRSDMQRFEVGEPVTLTASPDDCLVFPGPAAP